ncbi:MAG: hypothetical protein VKP62_03425 [Candidatus Sericytochromatia bacterium]|nr:hypothetical protein [Candidatus Sericytochromatia bacterium]
MAEQHGSALQELNIRMQDGRVLVLHRNHADQLVATSQPHRSAELRGFGPWPSWDANRRQATLTEPDEESGLFEPERLFVLREQYAFLAPGAQSPAADYVSMGPIDRAWWSGTEHIVQARQRAGKH